jgi:glutathione S-transferase
MNDALTLYDSPVSGNSYKVRLLLSQLGRPCRIVRMDIFAGEAGTESFRAQNPFGRVPFLVEGDFRLAESNAILTYLARGSPFWPDDSREQARALQWMFFEQNQLELGLGVSRYFLKFRPDHPGAQEAVAAQRARGTAALHILEHHLTGHDFATARYSIADIALYGYTHVAPEGGFPLDDHPAIRRWLARVESQPGYVSLTNS